MTPLGPLASSVVAVTTTAASKFSNACPLSFNVPWLSLPGGTELKSRDAVGQVWVTEADAIGLTSTTNPLTTYALNLKLTNPGDAPAFVYDRVAAELAQPSAPTFSNWEGLESEDAKLVQDGQGVLQPGALLLALLA